jgi:cell wall-associated NlpC family hydrolase
VFVSGALPADSADALRQQGAIDDFYVVPPQPLGEPTRRRIVQTALGFLGTPYRWGGPSAQTGFDCSGLVMTSYRLSGVSLPRTSREQYAGGVPVERRDLGEADLVFFATEGGGTPTHVGIYIGDGRFVHAPGSGDTVRVDELSSGYYHRHYLSGRSYLE